MREYVLVMLIAAATTYLVAGLCRRMAIKTGAMAAVRDRDVHATPTPYLGGLAMLVGVAVAFYLASRLPFLSAHKVVSQDARGIFLAALVICAVGALDDVLDLPIVAKPNAGMPKILETGEAVYSMQADTFAAHMGQLVEAGASLIGGCCGTTPEYIGALRGLKR